VAVTHRERNSVARPTGPSAPRAQISEDPASVASHSRRGCVSQGFLLPASNRPAGLRGSGSIGAGGRREPSCCATAGIQATVASTAAAGCPVRAGSCMPFRSRDQALRRGSHAFAYRRLRQTRGPRTLGRRPLCPLWKNRAHVPRSARGTRLALISGDVLLQLLIDKQFQPRGLGNPRPPLSGSWSQGRGRHAEASQARPGTSDAALAKQVRPPRRR